MADGGKAPTTAENTSEALAKPYMLVHPLSAEQTANLDEMLTILFDVNREQEITITEVQADVEVLEAGGGSGDVVGPSSATDGNVAVFDGTTGKLIRDGGNSLTGFATSVSVTLTAAEVRSLSSTPFQAIAGVADKIIVPFRWTMQQEMGATLFSVGPIVVPQYAGAAQGILDSIQVTNTANVSKTTHGNGTAVALANNFSASGVAVNLTSSADRTDGSGTFTFTISYILIDAVY